jgi:hypothetical protein
MGPDGLTDDHAPGDSFTKDSPLGNGVPVDPVSLLAMEPSNRRFLSHPSRCSCQVPHVTWYSKSKVRPTTIVSRKADPLRGYFYLSNNIAIFQRGPYDDWTRSWYSARAPVSLLIAVPLKVPEGTRVSINPWAGSSLGATPRGGAGIVPLSARCLFEAGGYNVSINLSNSPRWVGSRVPANVSLCGCLSIVTKSSTVARKRSWLVSLGNGLCGRMSCTVGLPLGPEVGGWWADH